MTDSHTSSIVKLRDIRAVQLVTNGNKLSVFSDMFNCIKPRHNVSAAATADGADGNRETERASQRLVAVENQKSVGGPPSKMIEGPSLFRREEFELRSDHLG
jgi:hypothetical protein